MDMRTSCPPGEFSDLNADALRNGSVHPAQSGLTGRGVVCCIIDYGFDFLHPSLRHEDGSTRFAHLIDQNGVTLERRAIDRLIRQCACDGDRTRADDVYDPHAHYFGQDGVGVGAHGSWVASIAAGSRSPRFTGVAPEATLIGVQLALPDHAWRETCLEDVVKETCCATPGATRWRSYDQSPAIIDALDRGLAAALELAPDGIVFNLSIGAWAGSHHPRAGVNRALSSLAARNDDTAFPMTFVVVGTGNAGADEGHFQTKVAPGGTQTFAWRMRPGSSLPEKLEIWSDQAVDVILQQDANAGEAASLKSSRDRQGPQHLLIGQKLVAISELETEACGGLYCTRILVAPDSFARAAGAEGDAHFTIELRAASQNSRPAEVHAWVERNCAGAASRLAPAMGEATLTSLASAPGVVAVAGLDGERVLDLSGHGPAPWRQLLDQFGDAPMLAAPGAGLWGVRSKTTDFMRGSGTSGATAIVTGASALAIEVARRCGQRLDREALITALIGGRAGQWSPATGWGALSFSAPCANARPGAPQSRLQPSTFAHPRNHSIVEGDLAP